MLLIKHLQLLIILRMHYFFFQEKVIIDAIIELFEVSVTLRKRAGSAKEQVTRNSSNNTDYRTIDFLE